MGQLLLSQNPWLHSQKPDKLENKIAHFVLQTSTRFASLVFVSLEKFTKNNLESLPVDMASRINFASPHVED